jgi:hypothetical protein
VKEKYLEDNLNHEKFLKSKMKNLMILERCCKNYEDSGNP